MLIPFEPGVARASGAESRSLFASFSSEKEVSFAGS
jgi:hypothetical protein